MADEKKSTEKTIEMRLAEIEDKLAKLHVTEEEIKAYNKVAGMLGGAGAGAEAQSEAAQAAAPAICVIAQCIIPRQISRFINRGITPRINRGINECNECGPCACFQGGGGSGGFGGFGQ